MKLQTRAHGQHEGRLEILFSEDQSYEESQAFAQQFMTAYGMTLLKRIDGPGAWLWDVRRGDNYFVFGYNDFPCETTLFAADADSDDALLRLSISKPN
jgi:hypothetical protein